MPPEEEAEIHNGSLGMTPLGWESPMHGSKETRKGKHTPWDKRNPTRLDCMIYTITSWNVLVINTPLTTTRKAPTKIPRVRRKESNPSWNTNSMFVQGTRGI
jgi:hypothetical protein